MSRLHTAATDPDQHDIAKGLPQYSYHVDPATAFKEASGRIINSVSDQYYLPTDNEEWNRLHKQHVAITLALDGLYPAKSMVHAVLSPQEGQEKHILDLGCGSGVWSVEMAKQFPWAQVLGIDLAPCPIIPDELAGNCRFELHDINTGLARFKNQFDVVHLRFASSGLKDFAQRMKDIHACLRPGGIVLWIEMDFRLYYTKDFKYVPPASELNPEGSWVQRPLAELRRTLLKFGSDLDTMESMIDAGLWSDPYIDPETCQTASLYLPAGHWATSEDEIMAKRIALISSLMKDDMLSGMESVKPVNVRAGWSVDTVDEWIKLAKAEFTEMRSEPALRARLAWGRRRASDGAPAPILPIITGTLSNEEIRTPSPYPYFFVYESQEVAQEQTAARNKERSAQLPPLPTRIA